MGTDVATPGPEAFATLQLALAAAEARADQAEAQLAAAHARTSDDQARIADLRLQIYKLKRRRRSTSPRAVGPVPTSWPCCCSRNLASISRCTARLNVTPAKV